MHHDDQLPASLAAGDIEALREAIRRYGPAVAAMVTAMGLSRSERSELLDEVFLELWRLAPSFDPARAGFRTWFITLAHRRAVLMLRRGREPGRGVAAAEAGAAVAEEALSRVDAAGAGRPASDRAAQRLALAAYFGGVSHSELGLSYPGSNEQLRSELRRGLLGLTSSLAGRTP